MKKVLKTNIVYLLIFFTIPAFLSCHKDSIDSGETMQTRLKAHTWILDSALISFGDTSWWSYFPQEDIYLNFTDSFLINTNLTLTPRTKDTLLYKLVEPNKIYQYQWNWWQPPTTTDTSEYTIIELLTNQSLVMKYKQQIHSSDQHFHAEE